MFDINKPNRQWYRYTKFYKEQGLLREKQKNLRQYKIMSVVFAFVSLTIIILSLIILYGG